MMVFMSVVVVKEGGGRPSGKCGYIVLLLSILSNGWYCHCADTQGACQCSNEIWSLEQHSEISIFVKSIVSHFEFHVMSVQKQGYL